MDKQRYNDIVNERSELTTEEVEQGWHYCLEWDFRLIGPGMREMQACECYNLTARILDWIYARLRW